jgi:hypothetical protein
MLPTSTGMLPTLLPTSTGVLPTVAVGLPVRPGPDQVDDLGQRLALLIATRRRVVAQHPLGEVAADAPGDDVLDPGGTCQVVDVTCAGAREA